MGRKDSRDEMDSQVASSITQRFGNIRALAKSVFLNEFFNEIFEEIYYKFLYICEKHSNPPYHWTERDLSLKTYISGFNINRYKNVSMIAVGGKCTQSVEKVRKRI